MAIKINGVQVAGTGKSAYLYAQSEGYTGTAAQFAKDLANTPNGVFIEGGAVLNVKDNMFADGNIIEIDAEDLDADVDASEVVYGSSNVKAALDSIDEYTVNGKKISENPSLAASDVGARPNTWTPSASDVGARPSTWTPTKSDIGLGNVDNTSDANKPISTATQTALDTKADKTQLSNRNLLDNAWFTVNQRGVTSWTNTYGVDRWIGSNATGSITSNSDNTITIISGSSYAQIFQRLELNTLEVGKTYTISVITSNGIETKTFTLMSTLTRYKLGTVTIHTNKLSGYYEIFVGNYTPNTTVTIKAVKLEVGSISTLHLDAPPNYAEELLKCQRYFYSCTQGKTGAVYLGNANCTNTYALCYIPVNMRVHPTVSIKGSISDFVINNGSSAHYPSNVAIDGSNSCNCVTLLFYVSGNSNGQCASIYLNSGKTSDIWISADL